MGPEFRVNVVTAGAQDAPAVAMDAPSDDEVMRAFERANPIQGGLPFLHEVQRNNVRIVKEKIADYVDPPRFVPLIGPALEWVVHVVGLVVWALLMIKAWQGERYMLPMIGEMADERTGGR